MHTIYKIEKTQPVATSQAIGGGSYAHDDIPKSSRSRSCKSNKMNFAKWLKAIFGKCTYAAECAYETQMEQREQRGEHLPPLAPPPPPQYDLPSLSDIDSDDDEEEEQ
jgi:hypothetical protein